MALRELDRNAYPNLRTVREAGAGSADQSLADARDVPTQKCNFAGTGGQREMDETRRATCVNGTY